MKYFLRCLGVVNRWIVSFTRKHLIGKKMFISKLKYKHVWHDTGSVGVKKHYIIRLCLQHNIQCTLRWFRHYKFNKSKLLIDEDAAVNDLLVVLRNCVRSHATRLYQKEFSRNENIYWEWMEFLYSFSYVVFRSVYKFQYRIERRHLKKGTFYWR